LTLTFSQRLHISQSSRRDAVTSSAESISSEWNKINGDGVDPQAALAYTYGFWVVEANVPAEQESQCVGFEDNLLPNRWKSTALNAPISADITNLTGCGPNADKVVRFAKAGLSNTGRLNWQLIEGPLVDPALAPMQKLSFDWAHQYVDSMGEFRAMILAVPVGDCAQGLDTIWQASNNALSTAINAAPAESWEPQDCQEWATQEVDLGSSITQKRKLIFAFGFGDGYQAPAYMDNICWEGKRSCPEGLEIPIEKGIYTASYLCEDDEGWTHFVKAAEDAPISAKDQLLFSLLIPAGASLEYDPSALHLVVADSAAYQIQAPYVKTSLPFFVAGRYVEVDSSLNFGGSEFEIRYYFGQSLPEGLSQRLSLDQLAPEMLVAYHTPWGIAARPDEGQMAVDSSSFGERLPQSVAGTLGWELQTQGDFFSASFAVKEVGLIGMGSDAMGLGFGARYPQPLRDFAARQKGAGHLLSWTSERELLATEYEILHSYDGDLFESLGMMDAEGRDSILLGPTPYENLQAMNEPGLHYYAILLHHANGYTIASDTVSVKFELSKLVRTYPNPLEEKLYIDPDFEWNESLILQLFDSRRTVFAQREWMEPGGEMSVDIPNIPPGIYFFQIQSGELTIQGKLLKTQ
ncbi:MAG: hypothetical protein AAFP02_00840, partial [Bacteroidota bacterium]